MLRIIQSSCNSIKRPHRQCGLRHRGAACLHLHRRPRAGVGQPYGKLRGCFSQGFIAYIIHVLFELESLFSPQSENLSAKSPVSTNQHGRRVVWESPFPATSLGSKSCMARPTNFRQPPRGLHAVNKGACLCKQGMGGLGPPGLSQSQRSLASWRGLVQAWTQAIGYRRGHPTSILAGRGDCQDGQRNWGVSPHQGPCMGNGLRVAEDSTVTPAVERRRVQ